MSEQPKQIVIFDSEEFYTSVLDLVLYNAGLTLSGKAANRSQAERLVKQIQDGNITPDIAVIDTMIQDHHEEGAVIAKKLRSLVPKIKIIAYTIIKEPLEWADYSALKSQRDPSQSLIKGLVEVGKLQLDTNGVKDVS